MNIKAISVNVGKALLVNALFMLIAIFVSISNGHDSAFGPLTTSFIITLIVGAFPFIFVKKTQSLTLMDGFITIVVSWLLSFIFGMLPYVMWGGEFTLINALFESVSGYTTTGATILTNVEALPDSLLFWRSSTHFIGGLGVVVFLLLVLPDASPFRLRLTNLELSSLSKEGYRYKSSKVVWVIALVYFGITIVTALCFWAAGMTFFEAVNHSFSVVSTGGFSTRNLSLGGFESNLINIIAMVFMAISAMHFGLIYAAFATRSFKPFNTAVVKYYYSAIVVFSVLTMISLLTKGGYDSVGKAAMDSTFTIISYMSSTGFAICDNATWPLPVCVILVFISLHCGCSGSTTGGFKADRLVVSVKAFAHELKHKLHPSSVSQVRMDGHLLSDDSVKSIVLYVVLYILLILLSTFIVSLCGLGGVEAFSGVVACIGSVGPGLGEVSALGNYASLPSLVKIVYAFDMFLGRVEIYPVFIVLYYFFNRRR